MPGRPCCCGGGGKVLLWLTDNNISASIFDNLQAVYEDMGLTVHTNTTWSTNVSAYSLIIWPVADSDPTWWDDVTGGGWTGRVIITAETAAFGIHNDSIAYVDGLSDTTGIGVVGAIIDFGPCDIVGSAETDDLTAGVDEILYGDTSKTSGGTVLSVTFTGSEDWLAHDVSEGIDWVISGDSNWISDTCPDMVSGNETLLQNFWTVPVA